MVEGGSDEFKLKRNFKPAFGTTVNAYLNQHKMTAAKNMLIEQDLTIAEVSEKMGYRYATHFSSAFKKKYFDFLPNKIKSGKLLLLIFLEEFSVILENLESYWYKLKRFIHNKQRNISAQPADCQYTINTSLLILIWKQDYYIYIW